MDQDLTAPVAHFDDLFGFLNWWMTLRPVQAPPDGLVHTADTHGVVLYRQPPYQVELFNVRPNSEIAVHGHPNVDSFEVFVSGDIVFSRESETHTPTSFGQALRVRPGVAHGGHFGPRGGCFLSVQKWINGAAPTFVGDDWHDAAGNNSYRDIN